MILPKIDYYILTLIKKNSLYILSGLFFLYLLLVILPQKITSYKSTQEDVSILRKEIATLVQQKSLVMKYTPEELDKLVQLLNTVLPEKYDEFSIFSAIDDLERNSQLKFISYSSPFTGLSATGFTITVEAQGTHEAILHFLENYKTIGGRLVEIDQVSIKPGASTVTFSVLFYAKQVANSTTLRNISPKTLEAIREIQRRVSLPTMDKNVPEIVIIPKSNPFQ